MMVRDTIDCLRFFRVVPPVPRLLTGTIALVASMGAVVTALDPSRAPQALAPVLLLQLFAASSGFTLPARRGHYDLLLTRRGARVTAALVHWGASIAPGMVAWLLLACAELVGSQGHQGELFAVGTCSAMAVVSTIPWASGVALPRFCGAIGWLVVLVATRSGLTLQPEWPVGLSGAGDVVWLSFLVNPFAGVGVALTRTGGLAVVPALALAAMAMTAACVWVARADVPLEAGQ